jgi:hypothetical protein
MHRTSFHGFHIHLPATLTVMFTVVAYFLILLLAWEIIKYTVSWIWMVLPPPLAWGG